MQTKHIGLTFGFGCKINKYFSVQAIDCIIVYGPSRVKPRVFIVNFASGLKKTCFFSGYFFRPTVLWVVIPQDFCYYHQRRLPLCCIFALHSHGLCCRLGQRTATTVGISVRLSVGLLNMFFSFFLLLWLGLLGPRLGHLGVNCFWAGVAHGPPFESAWCNGIVALK